MLKFIYEKQEDIPEGLRDHYTEVNGKWALNCEGAVPSSRLDEFRDNNVQLKAKLEKFEGIDPEKARELIGKAAEIEASKAKTDEEVQKLIEKRVNEMKISHEQEIAKLDEKLATVETQLSERIIDSSLLEAGTSLGLRSSAHPDLISRGKATFKLVDGQPVALDEKGEKVYGADGQPLTPKDFVAKLAKDAPHLFEPSEGGGGQGSGSNNGISAGANPWKTETFNLSQQARILKQSPEEARRLAAQAGTRIKI